MRPQWRLPVSAEPPLITLQTIADMRTQLDDLQRQLGSGKKSTSYAGLGLDRGLTIGLRSQLSAISGYQQSITQVGVRLDLMQTQLSQFDEVTQSSKSSIMLSQFALNGASQTQDQRNIKSTLDQLVGMLNTGADGRYLFSGRSVTQVPIDTTDHILNGDGLKAGLKQLIERAPPGRSRRERAWPRDGRKLRRDLDVDHRGCRDLRPQAGRRLEQHRRLRP